jgi:hypothetical protein
LPTNSSGLNIIQTANWFVAQLRRPEMRGMVKYSGARARNLAPAFTTNHRRTHVVPQNASAPKAIATSTSFTPSWAHTGKPRNDASPTTAANIPGPRAQRPPPPPSHPRLCPQQFPCSPPNPRTSPQPPRRPFPCTGSRSMKGRR